MARINKKLAVICCRAVLAVVLLLGVAAVVLYLTLLRPPRVVAASVDTQLSAYSVRPPELNLSLAVEVTLHNPNHAAFKYGEVITAVAYHGTPVGRAAAPPGKVPARSTRTVGARVQVDAARVIMDRLYVDDVDAGTLPFEAATAVGGKTALLKVSAEAEVACSVVLYPFKRESGALCTSAVHVN